MMVPTSLRIAAGAVTTGFLALTIVIPVFAVLSQASLAKLQDPIVLAIARTTFTQALLSALGSLVVGIPWGLWAARNWQSGLAPWIRGLFLAPYGVPSVVAGIAWVGILSPFDLAYRMEAVILAHVFFNAPLVAWAVAEAVDEVPLAHRESILLLGGNRASVLRHLLLPAAAPAIASTMAQVMSLCAMSFGLVMVLGGGPPVQTLETALYSRIRFGELDMEGALACAVWQLLITLSPWTVALALRARAYPRASHRSSNGEGSRVEAGFCLLASSVFILPYLWPMLSNIFQPNGFQLGDAEWVAALWDSLRISMISAFLSTVAACLAVLAIPGGKLRRIVTAIFILPSGVSILILSLGFWMAYSRWIDPFEGSEPAIVVLQAAVFFPMAFRVLWPRARGVQARPLEAALGLGAGVVRAFWLVEWPRWRPVVSGVFLLGVSAGMAEIAAVSFFAHEGFEPLSLLISRLKSRYLFNEAEAVSGILLVASMGLAIVGSRIAAPEGGWSVIARASR